MDHRGSQLGRVGSTSPHRWVTPETRNAKRRHRPWRYNRAIADFVVIAGNDTVMRHFRICHLPAARDQTVMRQLRISTYRPPRR